MARQKRGGKREISLEIAAKDGQCLLSVGAVDADFDVEAAGAENGRIDEVLAIRGADHNDILQAFHSVDLGQELGNDGALHV